MSFRSRSLQRQQGNTLVGIIIGLVIGLAIAVVVALVISKGATPFTDKSGKAGKSSEPTAGQISDPNKPMYGNKDAAREASKDFAREQQSQNAAPAPAAVPAPAAPAAPVPAAPAAPQPAPAAKPPADALQQVVDKIEASSKAKAAAAGDEKYIYYLQAGAFREVADAENTRAKLALLGFEASVSDYRSNDTGVLHRVRMGPYSQVEAMNKVRSKLSDNGIDVAVVRTQK
jgi:cell division protein FtsN